jgi:starch synthase
MNILIAASECIPFVKVGGLADVVGTFPKYLKNLGDDIRIIIPKYKKINNKRYKLKTLPYNLSVRVGGNDEYFTIKTCETADGIKVYFIESLRYFNREGIYGGDFGDFGDNRERYIFFSKAVLKFCEALKFKPDIIHCHDWQTGLIPAYLKTVMGDDTFFSQTSTVFTIHNIAYQGHFSADTVVVAGLRWEDFNPAGLEFYNGVNFMKCGIRLADAVSTVSPTYSKEIKEFNGCRMEAVLNSRNDEIYGILNGIDYDYWNPEIDKSLAANFSRNDLSGKKICKNAVQVMCGFEQREDAYLLGCVSRLDYQKGFDVIIDAMYSLRHENMQFVILGSGDANIRRQLQAARNEMPNNVAAFFEYNEVFSHQIYAGIDAYMMPSKFEPCGISQIIALSYASIPIVNRTGGLSDTVVYYNHFTKQGNGFMFNMTYGENFVQTIKKSEVIFRDKLVWEQLLKNAISCRFSWDNSAAEYRRIYERLYHHKKLLGK